MTAVRLNHPKHEYIAYGTDEGIVRVESISRLMVRWISRTLALRQGAMGYQLGMRAHYLCAYDCEYSWCVNIAAL